ncbi:MULTISPECIES: hypothetical protein [Kordiimonas]|jgi:hypothetical protein|uniref:Uncharacterized protein n=1 Tax=Kordiimonas lacus TaxID=637679 RepID=A0A1G7C0X2_9PROT|nr:MULTISPECIES: hypothetical protein [Kordiimonas]SDE32998.1 hypothetical protein SAMN04488071_2614 [Kordiimonas lacus]
MARPIPKDAEDKVGGIAKRSELRSVAVWAFVLGGVFGFALGATMFSGGGGSIYFMLGAAVIGALWYLASGRRKKKNKE